MTVREVLRLLEKDGPQAGGFEGGQMRYAVVIERSETGFGAFVPDLPGCVAAAETEAEVRQLIREAIELHVEALREGGEPVPPPSSSVEYVEIPTAA